MLPYLQLAGAIGLEITATSLLKLSAGFTRPLPSVGSSVLYMLCFYLFARVLQHIDLGVAYATWSAVGIVAAAVIAAAAFGQKLTGAGVVGVALIITGCVVLNLFGSAR